MNQEMKKKYEKEYEEIVQASSLALGHTQEEIRKFMPFETFCGHKKIYKETYKLRQTIGENCDDVKNFKPIMCTVITDLLQGLDKSFKSKILLHVLLSEDMLNKKTKEFEKFMKEGKNESTKN